MKLYILYVIIIHVYDICEMIMELKQHNNNLFRCNRLLGFDVVLVLDQNRCDSSVALHMSPFNLYLIPKAMHKT